MSKTALTRTRRPSRAAALKLYADLANTDPLAVWLGEALQRPTPQRLTAAQRQHLVDRVARHLSAGQLSPHARAAATFSVERLHRDAWSWIRDLLEGQAVKPGDRIGQVTWVLDGNSVEPSWPAPGETQHGELVALILERPFPFRRCKQCGKVFVRRFKRECCSTDCHKWWRQRDQRGVNREAYNKHMAEYMRYDRQLREELRENGETSVAQALRELRSGVKRRDF